MTNTEDPDIAMARFIAQFRNDPLGFVMAVYPWDSDSGLQLVRLPPKYRSRFPRCEYGPDLWACEFLDELGRRCRENRLTASMLYLPHVWRLHRATGLASLR